MAPSTFHPSGSIKWGALSCIAAILFLTASEQVFGALPSTNPFSYKLSNQSDQDVSAATSKEKKLLQNSHTDRTAFHFQPIKNWMNDPNGPLFYKGYYHLFYQYNPYGAVWGNIVWGHAVSTDLIHWIHLPAALVPDQWYDIKGVWSGSATFLSKVNLVLLYTGWSNASRQVQNVAVATNPSDPLLRSWSKLSENPILVATAGINSSNFRDPTTGWTGSDGLWRVLVGSKIDKNETGLALLYKSHDFVKWQLADHSLHSVANTGMWECPDFYPVSMNEKKGLDTSVNGPLVKHVLKVSLDDKKRDYYALGTYDTSADIFIPENKKIDVGIGLRYDYGKYYASKTFYDDNKQRRILWGWINESDSIAADKAKGWSSVQGIPRKVWVDESNPHGIKQWPIEEIEKLRHAKHSKKKFWLKKGSILKLKAKRATQLDIEVSFDLPSHNQQELVLNDEMAQNEAQINCGKVGATKQGTYGPFGLYVLATKDLQERTSVFFYLRHSNKGWRTLVCSDQSRSTLLPNIDKTIYGSFVPVTKGEDFLSLRVIVDHSIIETFAQGGKVCITSRVYPTRVNDDSAHLYLFNHGNQIVHVQMLAVWEMSNVVFDIY
ncbi:hypothetical protein O6H91_02G079100 [Diphasiastrum complanatum]|uniref:Uncharacterized protein n=1 Tax=Diphasiastrum complanatum TaxID=34168 RepID=A0ACC2EHK3_DIPCM|nr:hypothetical protein O6H91_02G079100 [Diphasiastrum complanatum]